MARVWLDLRTMLRFGESSVLENNQPKLSSAEFYMITVCLIWKCFYWYVWLSPGLDVSEDEGVSAGEKCVHCWHWTVFLYDCWVDCRVGALATHVQTHVHRMRTYCGGACLIHTCMVCFRHTSFIFWYEWFDWWLPHLFHFHCYLRACAYGSAEQLMFMCARTLWHVFRVQRAVFAHVHMEVQNNWSLCMCMLCDTFLVQRAMIMCVLLPLCFQTT